ncbi:hypothetical protein KBB96_10315 [Luteolibacter ambystomatis]|uniref:Uncharacterized protein n=1 Tax=Luteolibacter ambystomatis TaxID=2824561 RepID=A0A975G5P3_9BACT|nr:hypothetical protein [Luteolibacter ambystomatis]QUE49267.1 hypothetical protein KBB96_10315 [Luteolibacter ambystomatis]
MTITLTVSWDSRLPGDAPPLPAVPFGVDRISLELDCGVIRSLRELFASFVADVLPPTEANHARFREFHTEMGSLGGCRSSDFASSHEDSPSPGVLHPPRFLEILERLIRCCEHMERGDFGTLGDLFNLTPGGER